MTPRSTVEVVVRLRGALSEVFHLQSERMIVAGPGRDLPLPAGAVADGVSEVAVAARDRRGRAMVTVAFDGRVRMRAVSPGETARVELGPLSVTVRRVAAAPAVPRGSWRPAARGLVLVAAVAAAHWGFLRGAHALTRGSRVTWSRHELDRCRRTDPFRRATLREPAHCWHAVSRLRWVDCDPILGCPEPPAWTPCPTFATPPQLSLGPVITEVGVAGGDVARAGIRVHFDELRPCHLDASGDVRVTLIVGADGEVISVEARSTTAPDVVTQCVAQRARRWRFPPTGWMSVAEFAITRS